jgi:hypothetical protein
MANETKITGGCLCGQLRYEATGAPQYAGLCFCNDCQRSSGSAFIPFMGFAAADISITGETKQATATAIRGGTAVRNFCPRCGGLVFGGVVGVDQQHTIYAGSLDDRARFEPKMAIFIRNRPAWAPLPSGVETFESLPGL